MFTEVSGDLFDYALLKLDAIGHGCNTQGVMGAGVAKIMRDRYPGMNQEYVDRCIDGRFNLGDIFVYTNARPVVFNLATQVRTGADARIEGIFRAVHKMLDFAERTDIKSIGIPRIGCGIGGLDWPQVAEALAMACSLTPRVRLTVVTLP